MKNIQFLIVGNDSFKWRKLGYKNIHTFDFTENVRDKGLIFCASDCKILTSINENFQMLFLSLWRVVHLLLHLKVELKKL